MGGVYFGVKISENLVKFPLIHVIKLQRLNLSCCISQNTFTYCFYVNAIFQHEHITLFHILRLLSNKNLYFCMVLYIAYSDTGQFIACMCQISQVYVSLRKRYESALLFLTDPRNYDETKKITPAFTDSWALL